MNEEYFEVGFAWEGQECIYVLGQGGVIEIQAFFGRDIPTYVNVFREGGTVVETLFNPTFVKKRYINT